MNGLGGKRHVLHQWEIEVARHVEAPLRISVSSVLHRMIDKHPSETLKQTLQLPHSKVWMFL